MKNEIKLEALIEKCKEIEYLIQVGRYRKAKELTQKLREDLQK